MRPRNAAPGSRGMSAGQVFALVAGLAMVVIGGYLTFRSPTNIHISPSAASQPVVAREPAESQSSRRLEPIVFADDQLLCEIELAPETTHEQVDQFLSEAARRIERLGDREIVFIAADAMDGLGSLRFNDRTARIRWVVHWRAITGDDAALLVYRVAEPTSYSQVATLRQMSRSEFAAMTQEVMGAIRLPLEDAASELNLTVHIPQRQPTN